MSEFKFQTNISEFNDIKQELKKYYASKNISFLEGSNFSLFLDSLAYVIMMVNYTQTNDIHNKHLMLANNIEATIELANKIGYNARGKIPSKITVEIIYSGNYSGNSFNIKNLSMLGTTKQIPFANNNITMLKVVDEDIWKAEVNLYEKEFKTFQYSGLGIENQNFILPESNIIEQDLVIKSIINGVEFEWSEVKSYSKTPDYNARIYFIETLSNRRLKIKFGNGVIGQMPNLNETIQVSYNICKGDEANGEESFELQSMVVEDSELGLNDFKNYTFSISAKSYGGKNYESITEIAQNASKYFSRFGSSIIQYDYENLLKIRNAYISFSSVENVDYIESKKTENYLFAVPTELIPETPGVENTINKEDLRIKQLVVDDNVYENIKADINPLTSFKLSSPTYIFLTVTPYIEIDKYKNFDNIKNEVYAKMVDEFFYNEDKKLIGFNKILRNSILKYNIDQNQSIISSSISSEFSIITNKKNIIDKYFLKIPQNFLAKNGEVLESLNWSDNTYNSETLKIEDTSFYCNDLDEDSVHKFQRVIYNDDSSKTNSFKEIMNIYFTDDILDVNKSSYYNFILNGNMINTHIIQVQNNLTYPLYFTGDFSLIETTTFTNSYTPSLDVKVLLYFSVKGENFLIGEIYLIDIFLYRNTSYKSTLERFFNLINLSIPQDYNFINFKASNEYYKTNEVVEKINSLTLQVFFEELIKKEYGDIILSSKKLLYTFEFFNNKIIVTDKQTAGDDYLGYRIDDVSKTVSIIEDALILGEEQIPFVIDFKNSNPIVKSSTNYVNINYATYKNNKLSIENNNLIYYVYAHEIYDESIIGTIDYRKGIIEFKDDIFYKNNQNSNKLSLIKLSDLLNKVMNSVSENYFINLKTKNNILGLNVEEDYNFSKGMMLISDINKASEKTV